MAVIAASLRAAAMIPELPPDESGLGALVAEHAIDDFQYGQLLVYYALPLSVPQGELALLAQVFPDAADLLPDPDTLESYRPFDNRQIQRLLGDFPILVNFEPVLRYNESLSTQAGNGEAIFGINRSSISELKGHRARFRHKNQYMAAEGSLSLSDTGAVWQTRRVDVFYSGITAQIGSFRQPVPGDLFFGRFSPLALTGEGEGEGAMTAVTANWLYGGSNTWNGAAVNMKEIPGAPMAGAGVFCHIRGEERAVGGMVDFRAGRKTRVCAGVSGFETVDYAGGGGDGESGGGVKDNSDNDDGSDDGDDDIDDTGGVSIIKKYVYTAHLYGEYKGKTWRAVAETGLPLGRANIVPALSLRLNYRIKESSAEYRYTGYPDDFFAPMSRVKRQILSEAGQKDPPRPLSIQKHSLRMAVPVSLPLFDMAKLLPEIDFTEYQGAVRRVHGRAEIRARAKGVDAAVKHASKIFTMGVDSALHTSSASLNWQTGRPVEIRAAAQSIYGYYKNPRNSYTLESRYTGLPNAVITPFIRGRYVTNHEYWLGLKTELHLYKKTWTGITAEMPVGVKGANNVHIKGSSSYAL